ncbi:hypothetical protein GCM10027610_080800 [Dactylosporangium cerinum]
MASRVAGASAIGVAIGVAGRGARLGGRPMTAIGRGTRVAVPCVGLWLGAPALQLSALLTYAYDRSCGRIAASADPLPDLSAAAPAVVAPSGTTPLTRAGSRS